MPRPKRAARKRVLTELFIRKVKPEKNRVLIWDLKQHGLVLVVEPTGRQGARPWVPPSILLRADEVIE